MIRHLQRNALLAFVAVVFATPALAAPRVIDGSLTAPIAISGTSGGTKPSDCGNLPAQPSQELKVTDRFVQESGYLRIAVEAAGDPTLLIEGPTGRFCILANKDGKKGPEMAGRWLPGTYRIFVGDRKAASAPFKLSISSTANSSSANSVTANSVTAK
jgi:hypothetical protein